MSSYNSFYSGLFEFKFWNCPLKNLCIYITKYKCKEPLIPFSQTLHLMLFQDVILRSYGSSIAKLVLCKLLNYCTTKYSYVYLKIWVTMQTWWFLCVGILQNLRSLLLRELQFMISNTIGLHIRCFQVVQAVTYLIPDETCKLMLQNQISEGFGIKKIKTLKIFLIHFRFYFGKNAFNVSILKILTQ